MPRSLRRLERPWSGALALGPGWAIFVGRVGDNTPHAHQAIQLCVMLRGALRVSVDERSAVASPGIAIPAGRRHRLEATQGAAVLLYLDPRSDAGESLALARGRASRRAASRVREVRRLAASGAPAAALRASMLRAFGAVSAPAPAPAPTPARDPRVASAIDRIESQVALGRVSAAAIARSVGLSPSRLAALFRRETGIAMRPFVLWARLTRAVRTIAGGASLSASAHAAGFADAAHLARTFRRMFGTTLSASVARLDARE